MNKYLTPNIILNNSDKPWCYKKLLSNSMEYGKKKSPQIETTSSRALSYYGNAKLNATLYSLKMFKKINFPITVLRPYQVYGPNQEVNRLIPYVISQSHQS